MENTTALEGDWTNATSAVNGTELVVYATWSQAALFGSLTIIVGILGFFGNLMVFAAVSLSKSLQDTSHVFLVNLAVSDFITAMTLPFNGISVISGAQWPFPRWMCGLTGVLLHMSVPTSILSLAAIAVNRYIIITKNLQVYQRIYTSRSVAVMTALLWIVPFLAVATPQLIPNAGGIYYNPIIRFCLWDQENPLMILFQNIAFILYLCCTVIIIICYIAISVFVWKRVRATRKRLRAPAGNTNVGQQASHGLDKKHIEVTKNSAIVVLIFFICVLPLAANLTNKNLSLLVAYFGLLMGLPICLNPLIYALKHPTFKTVFRCMIYRRYQEIPQPSEWLKKILRRQTVAR